MVRGWLLDDFSDLAAEKNPVKFTVVPNRRPMVYPRDKSIMTKCTVDVAEVPRVIEALSKLERVPQIIFFSTERKPRSEN